MFRFLSLAFGLLTASIFCTSEAQAQLPRQLQTNRSILDSSLRVGEAAISEQRVQRQTEVARLDRMIDEMGTRMVRLERQALSLSRIPSVSIPVARAELDFAKLQFDETFRLHKQSQASDLELAAARLAMARAEGKMETAKTAHAEGQLILELDVAYARRQLLTASAEQRQMERLVAKGYASSDTLRYQVVDVELAEKQLRLAQLRLDAQRQLSGTTAEPDEPAEPAESDQEK